MKKIISLFLCFGLIFLAVGCKNNMTPEEIEQKITKELQESKYMDAHINAAISGNIEGLDNKEISIDTDVKCDKSSEFPVLYISGNFGVEGMMTIPLTIYMDESGMILSAMGMTEKQEMSDKDKEEFQKAIKMSDNLEFNPKKTVKKSKVDGKDALEITYDTEELNKLLETISEGKKPEVKIDKFVAHYVLKNRDELDYMTADYIMTADGQSLNCKATVKYNSIGQPVEITPPSVDSSNSGGMDLLPNQN